MSQFIFVVYFHLRVLYLTCAFQLLIKSLGENIRITHFSSQKTTLSSTQWFQGDR